jgi:hypothetical protein
MVECTLLEWSSGPDFGSTEGSDVPELPNTFEEYIVVGVTERESVWVSFIWYRLWSNLIDSWVA